MAGYNRVVMVGNLTRDPEYKQLASGQALCRLGLATNRQFKNRQTGSMTQEVCYIDVDVWGAQAESCRQYLQKGRSVLIEGRLKLDTWEDPSGQNRSKHSIVADRVVFLSSGADAADVEVESDSYAPSSSAKPAQSFTSAPKAAAPAPKPAPARTTTLDPELEKDLSDQIEKIKQKNYQKTAASKQAAGEVDFKDQPPFEDELPF